MAGQLRFSSANMNWNGSFNASDFNPSLTAYTTVRAIRGIVPGGNPPGWAGVGLPPGIPLQPSTSGENHTVWRSHRGPWVRVARSGHSVRILPTASYFYRSMSYHPKVAIISIDQ